MRKKAKKVAFHEQDKDVLLSTRSVGRLTIIFLTIAFDPISRGTGHSKKASKSTPILSGQLLMKWN